MCKPAKASWDGSFWAVLALAAVVNFAAGLWTIARWLYRATVWAAPRVWRLARRGYRTARHRWVTRPVVLDRKPAAALPQQPTGLTLRDLRLKEPANR